MAPSPVEGCPKLHTPGLTKHLLLPQHHVRPRHGLRVHLPKVERPAGEVGPPGSSAGLTWHGTSSHVLDGEGKRARILLPHPVTKPVQNNMCKHIALSNAAGKATCPRRRTSPRGGPKARRSGRSVASPGGLGWPPCVKLAAYSAHGRAHAPPGHLSWCHRVMDGSCQGGTTEAGTPLRRVTLPPRSPDVNGPAHHSPQCLRSALFWSPSQSARVAFSGVNAESNMTKVPAWTHAL